MTIIAYRSGVVAADSRATHEDGTIDVCQKLHRKRVGKRDVVIGIAGDVYLAMVFVDFFGNFGSEPPSILRDANLVEDFEALILDRGKVYTSNHLCRLVEVETPFTALGSGRAAALGAMHCGRGAREAAAIACKVDPACALPIVTMQMPGKPTRRVTNGSG